MQNKKDSSISLVQTVIRYFSTIFGVLRLLCALLGGIVLVLNDLTSFFLLYKLSNLFIAKKSYLVKKVLTAFKSIQTAGLPSELHTSSASFLCLPNFFGSDLIWSRS